MSREKEYRLMAWWTLSALFIMLACFFIIHYGQTIGIVVEGMTTEELTWRMAEFASLFGVLMFFCLSGLNVAWAKIENLKERVERLENENQN